MCRFEDTKRGLLNCGHSVSTAVDCLRWKQVLTPLAGYMATGQLGLTKLTITTQDTFVLITCPTLLPNHTQHVLLLHMSTCIRWHTCRVVAW